MTKSTPASTAQPTCSSNIARTVAADCGVAGVVDVRVADVAGEQRAGLARHVRGDPQRLAVDLLERVLLADQPQLLAVGVVRERLDDVGAGVDELAVQLRHQLGVLEHDLGHERPRLQVAAPLEFEEVALGADDGALRETIEESAHAPRLTTRVADPATSPAAAPTARRAARATSAPASSSRAPKRNDGPDTLTRGDDAAVEAAHRRRDGGEPGLQLLVGDGVAALGGLPHARAQAPRSCATVFGPRGTSSTPSSSARSAAAS